MGPPPHIHHREDESFFVLEGEFEFVVGGQARRAKPGDFLTGPKGVPHFFRNVGQTPGRLLIICRPAGFENFAREFAELPVDQPPDIPRMIEIGKRHGIEFVLGSTECKWLLRSAASAARTLASWS